MLIGVPKETKTDEGRVALTPAGADALVRRGHQVIVETSPQSWAESDIKALTTGSPIKMDQGVDKQGPVALAAAVSAPAGDAPASEKPDEPKPETRVVVFGDSDFATNQLVDAYRNRDLFVNSVNWLLGDVEAIAIRPQQSRASRLQLSNEQLSSIRYLSLFVLPEAIAIAGVWAWWSRRRAPGR